MRMSLEIWSTIASVGTFLVVAATAVAALLQLRHMQAANKVQSIQTFFAEYEGPDLRDALVFVHVALAERLKEPQFRKELREGRLDRASHPEMSVCNFFDQWGLYFRDGVIDRQSFLRSCAGLVNAMWQRLEPVIALVADPNKGNVSFQDFEYLTVHARRWLARHPLGSYPKGMERIPLHAPTAIEDEAMPHP
jgi:hypothetical protein